MTITNIAVCGIGGQGVMTATEILAEAALSLGFDVKKTEVAGMSQRGGVVTSHLRFGPQVLSPQIMPGDADLHLFVGEMRLDQYLATRVVELVVHGMDLSEAIGIPSPPPIAAGRVALDVLLDLSSPEDVGSVLRLLSGRSGSLPLANVLA